MCIRDRSNGGSYVEEQHITVGGNVVEPNPAPNKQGYSFVHWSKINNGEAYNFADSVTEDFTCLLYTS